MIKDGVIVGGQEFVGSGIGVYFVFEEMFGDFELIMDMKFDWKMDSGFFVCMVGGGSFGIQVFVDY